MSQIYCWNVLFHTKDAHDYVIVAKLTCTSTGKAYISFCFGQHVIEHTISKQMVVEIYNHNCCYMTCDMNAASGLILDAKQWPHVSSYDE